MPSSPKPRFELLALALRHASFRPAAAQVLSTGREGIASLFASIAGRDRASESDDGMPADGMPAVFLALLDGIALQGLVDRSPESTVYAEASNVSGSCFPEDRFT